MPENPEQPREFDAVLGGEVAPPIDGAVLGGLEGVKRRLAVNSFEAKSAALQDTLNYGDNGLDIVIEVLNNQPISIQKIAYSLLKTNFHPKAKQAIESFNKYQIFECIYCLNGHTDKIISLTYLPSQNILISASQDTTVKIWSLKTRQLIHTLNTTVPAWKIYFISTSVSNDGQILCVGTERDSKIEVWNLQTGERTHVLQDKSKHNSREMSLFVMSPNGQVLFSNNFDGIIKVWDLKTGKKIYSFDFPSKITLLCVNPDGQNIVCFCDGYILIISSQTGEIKKCLPTDAMCDVWFYGNAIIKNGKHVVCGIENYANNPEVVFIDVETGTIIKTFTDKSMNIKTIGFTSNAKILATGGVANNNNNGIIKIWDLQKEIEMHVIEIFQSPMNAIAISPDGEMIFSSDDDMSIKIWGLPLNNQEK